MDYNYLVIEGNIGSGKTTLSQMIAEDHNARLLLERFEDNPFLPKFYKKPDQYAFALELSFLAERYQQLKKQLQSQDLFSSMTVADFYFSKSLIFAQITLSEDEFELYKKLYNIIYGMLPKPDLIVYLYARPKKLLENIHRRGREYEEQISLEYLEKVNSGYFAFFRQQSHQNVLVLDTTHVDFVKDKLAYQKVIKAIAEKPKNGMHSVSLDT